MLSEQGFRQHRDRAFKDLVAGAVSRQAGEGVAL